VAVLPSDGAFEALRGGRMLVACFRLGRLEEALEANYSAQLDVLAALTGLLDMTVETEAELAADPRCLLDPTLVRLNSVGKMFTSAYGRPEWLQQGWLQKCRNRYPFLAKSMGELAASAAAALPTTPLADIPLIGQLAKVAAGNGSLVERYHSVMAILRDCEATCETIERVGGVYAPAETKAREALPVLSAILELCYEIELDPLISDAGRRQMYLDSRRHSMDTWTLQPDEFAITADKEAQEYWNCKLPTLLFDGHLYLDPWDMPISVEECMAWDRDKPSIDIRQAHEASSHLLDEAIALRRWTIPQRAFVEVRVGPFIGVELTEVHDEVYFVWRAASHPYWSTSVGIKTQTFVSPWMLPKEQGGEEVAAVLETLMAALVRDFWVAEERRKIFDVKQRQRVGLKGASKAERHFVYLPRIRYISSGLRFDRLNEKLEHAGRARHFVRPFLRKADNPSPLQVAISRRENIRLPEGFTYVRGHYRGGAESQAIYRSRSAIALLYDVFKPQVPADEPLASNWFAFERAIAVLLEDHLGFTVRHKAVRGKGDAGIDILAEKTAGQVMEIWVVQCKFYAPKNEISPSIVRELIGSMVDMPGGSTQPVRGMIVTTSYFTPDALRLAVKHGIQTVDGEDLNAICSAVNRKVN